MRGLYAGFPPVKGARCRVVLSLEEEFAPHLVGTLLDHFAGMETTTAALTPAGSAA
jgi:purine nucleosidase